MNNIIPEKVGQENSVVSRFFKEHKLKNTLDLEDDYGKDLRVCLSM